MMIIMSTSLSHDLEPFLKNGKFCFLHTKYAVAPKRRRTIIFKPTFMLDSGHWLSIMSFPFGSTFSIQAKWRIDNQTLEGNSHSKKKGGWESSTREHNEHKLLWPTVLSHAFSLYCVFNFDPMISQTKKEFLGIACVYQTMQLKFTQSFISRIEFQAVLTEKSFSMNWLSVECFDNILIEKEKFLIKLNSENQGVT